LLIYARKNRCGRFEPPVGTGKKLKAAIKGITLTLHVHHHGQNIKDAENAT